MVEARIKTPGTSSIRSANPGTAQAEVHRDDDDGPVMKPRSGQVRPGQASPGQLRPDQAMAAVQLGPPRGGQPVSHRKQAGGYDLFCWCTPASRAGKTGNQAGCQHDSSVGEMGSRWRPASSVPSCVSNGGDLDLSVDISLHHRESLHTGEIDDCLTFDPRLNQATCGLGS